MDIRTQTIKEEIYRQYKNPMQFSKLFNIPYSTLTSAFKKGIGGTAVETVLTICDALDLDINKLWETKQVHNKPVTIGRFNPVPVLKSIQAGAGSITSENIVRYEMSDYPYNDSCFFIDIAGDTMEPRIFDGDLALIDKSTAVSNGDIAAVIIENEGEAISKYTNQNGAVILQPFNTDYETRMFFGDDM